MRRTTILNNHALRLFLIIIIAFVMGDDIHAQMTNFGNLYIKSGGSVKVNGSFVNSGPATDLYNSGGLQLTGDFTNNGNNLNASGTGTVIFSGTAAQNINGTQASAFYNITQTNPTNVIITNDQVINNTLTLTSGSFLLNGNRLTLNGGISYASGSLSATPASGLILNGAAVKNLYFKPGAHTIKDLTVNASATNVILADSLNITAGNAPGTLTVDGKLNTNNYLTLQSNAGGTSRVGPSTGIVNDNVTVERYTPANRAWRLLTAPLTATGSVYNNWQDTGIYKPGIGLLVTGPNPTPLNGLDASPLNNVSMFEWNTLSQKFVPVVNTKTTNLSLNLSPNADNKGYFIFVRGDRNPVNTNVANYNITTLRSFGKLQTGTQTFTAANKAGSYTLIGNPYASPVDFDSLVRTNLVKRFYVYDPTLNDVGGYVMLDDIDGDGNFTKSIEPSAQDKNIQSGQAFFVETIANLPASLTFLENSKSAAGNELVFRPKGNTSPGILRANLYIVNDGSVTMADGTYTEFSNNFSADIDYEDALKFGNVNEMFGMERKGIVLTAERRPAISIDDTLFYKLTKTTPKHYRIEFIAGNVESATIGGYLEDSYLKSSTPISLNGTTTVNFDILATNSASAAPDRFRIVFKKTALPLPVSITRLNATRINGAIAVEWHTENEINIRQYEVERSSDGSSFIKAGSVAASGIANYTWPDEHATKALTYYRLKCIDKDGSIQVSRIVKVDAIGSMEDGSISVYPNPVVNKKIGLQINNLPAGDYSCTVLNSAGQLVFTTTVSLTINSNRITLPALKLSQGIYRLRLTGSDKLVYTATALIE